MSDGLPGFTPTPLTPTMVPPPGFAVFFFPADDKPNMAHMFNAGVQRQLPWNSVLDVAYVGTRGKNIFVSRNINVPLPGPGNSTSGGRSSAWSRTFRRSTSGPVMANPGTTPCR